jgi:hypothetical protein
MTNCVPSFRLGICGISAMYVYEHGRCNGKRHEYFVHSTPSPLDLTHIGICEITKYTLREK